MITQIEPYEGYRTKVLPLLLEKIGLPLEGQDLYEFGVASGKSMIEVLKTLKDKNLNFNCFYGLDSFIGMPECHAEPLWQSEWAEGNFSSKETYDCKSVEEVITFLQSNIEPFLFQEEQTLKLIPGFYSDSLPTLEVESLRPAAILDIDCDLYSSTYEVLDFMATNSLIKPGTIIIYDDWGGSPGYITQADGESRAHKEICEKYNMKCELLFTVGQAFPHIHTFFIVTEIG